VVRRAPNHARSRRLNQERLRRIYIHYIGLKERIDIGEVAVEHLSTKNMFANLLTKPVQGSPLIDERRGLSNWPDTHDSNHGHH